MRKHLKLLSTKKLNTIQKEALSGYSVKEEKFIEVVLRSDLQIENQVNCTVFTSQNAVKAVFRESQVSTNKFSKVFCVGNKTAKLLADFDIKVEGISHSAYELALLLLEEKAENKITFFCGNLRRDELPDLLRENNIEVEEIEVYQTKLLENKIEDVFDGILFFSPSAVTSYIMSGNSNKSTAFCIGNTTAVAAIMKFENVYVAEEVSVEGVIKSIKENLK